jgi:hypothetical protein
LKRKCEICGTVFTRKPSQVRRQKTVYCSRKCADRGHGNRIKGSANPNFRGAAITSTCGHCGSAITDFRVRQYCSRRCCAAHQLLERFGGAIEDANHEPIVAALQAQGIPLIDLRQLGGGTPDVLAEGRFGLQLLEIKNPSTKYGRKGLSPAQKRFATWWKGRRVKVVHDVHEALRALGYR